MTRASGWSRRPGEVVSVVLARLLEQSRTARRARDRVGALPLLAVADVARGWRPGAASALVDWEGSEVARLRAFGVLHGVVLSALDPDDPSWLLDRLLGTSPAELDGRVA